MKNMCASFLMTLLSLVLEEREKMGLVEYKSVPVAETQKYSEPQRTNTRITMPRHACIIILY